MTGFPPSRGGENFHCRAARTASSWSRGCTDMGLTLRTTPLSSTISSSTAVVLMFRFEGSGGRIGSFFSRTDACRVSGSRRTNLGRFASLVLFDVWESAGEKWAHKRNDMRQHNRLRPDIEASKPDWGNQPVCRIENCVDRNPNDKAGRGRIQQGLGNRVQLEEVGVNHAQCHCAFGRSPWSASRFCGTP